MKKKNSSPQLTKSSTTLSLPKQANVNSDLIDNDSIYPIATSSAYEYLTKELGENYVQENIVFLKVTKNDREYDIAYTDKKIDDFVRKSNPELFKIHHIFVDFEGKTRKSVPHCSGNPFGCEFNISLEKARTLAQATSSYSGNLPVAVMGFSTCTTSQEKSTSWYWLFGAPIEGFNINISMDTGKVTKCFYQFGDH